MIKLITTDMDGTLLDENGQIPKEFFPLFKRMKDKNIKFVVASGRPYFTLYENFKPISDEIIYICDNGSMVVQNGKTMNVEGISPEDIHSILATCEELPHLVVIPCGTKGAYHMPCSKEALKEIDKYYIKKTIVDNLYDIDDTIFKIAILDLRGVQNLSYPYLDSYLSEYLSVVVSGKVWIDVTNKGVHKGNALKKIQEENNILFEETMAFGDFFNDVELLKNAYYSYVMENALDEMKQYGKFIAPKNIDHGVVQVIDEYLKTLAIETHQKQMTF